uniref:LysM domain-containing protein n=1 Tax=Hemiselmis andersenii TaxID=464988 RepID=A0A6U2FUY5_HEMAN|mmetsp:Transcript_34105/g.79918  ORF Transcript_34105/g.79918 Transcript_34105/m.79918 type:complete len:408 (+) Transcript_34105:50-1273(+)
MVGIGSARVLLYVACCLSLARTPHASPPVFVAPTPQLADAQNFTGYIGALFEVPMKVFARGVNLDPVENQAQYRPVLAPEEDPGLPNLAQVSDAVQTTTEYKNAANQTIDFPDFTESRTFTWTPHCEQADTYKVRFTVTNAQGSVTKPVQFTVLSPSPEIVAFDSTPIVTNVGCAVSISIDSREADLTLRALGNPNYSQNISVSYSRTERRGQVVQLGNRLEGATFQVLPGANAWDGVSARFDWVPARGQEAFSYTVCFHVKDTCGITAELVACRNISVEKCRICLHGGQTLQTVAAEYGTDYLSLYTANVNVLNPDGLAQGELVNTGVLYRVQGGDSMYSIATTFFSSAPQILSVNPDLKLILDTGGDIYPGDRLCMLPPVCNVKCQAGTCVQQGEPRLGIAEMVN